VPRRERAARPRKLEVEHAAEPSNKRDTNLGGLETQPLDVVARHGALDIRGRKDRPATQAAQGVHQHGVERCAARLGRCVIVDLDALRECRPRRLREIEHDAVGHPQLVIVGTNVVK
jgi:hypothetical protein